MISSGFSRSKKHLLHTGRRRSAAFAPPRQRDMTTMKMFAKGHAYEMVRSVLSRLRRLVCKL